LVDEALGGAAIVVEGEEVTEAVLSRLDAIEQTSWQVERGATAFNKPFFKDLVLSFSQLGAADVWILSIGEKDAAFLVNLVSGSRMCFLKTGFDLSLASKAPGATLFVYVVRDAFEREFTEIDFLQGDGEHKAFWATGRRSVRHVVVYRGAEGWFILVQRRWARTVARALRRLVRNLTRGAGGATT
jgi:CelD/BcsL family acetyltransferase involved in cellulose biosynthesis